MSAFNSPIIYLFISRQSMLLTWINAGITVQPPLRLLCSCPGRVRMSQMGNVISLSIIVVLVSNISPISAVPMHPYAIHYYSHWDDRGGILPFKSNPPFIYQSNISVDLPEVFLKWTIMRFYSIFESMNQIRYSDLEDSSRGSLLMLMLSLNRID